MSKVFSAAEVSQHKSENDLWIVRNGKVYDVTSYVDSHPGGVDTLMEVAGKDATTAFDGVGHSQEAKEELEKHLIGTLDPKDASALASGSVSVQSSSMSFIIIALLLAVCAYFIFA